VIDRDVSDEVTALDGADVVTVNDTVTPFVRCLDVPYQDRYLWVTVQLSPNMLQPYSKQPDATLDYGVTWTDWLNPGETIVSSSWDVPEGLTIVDEYVTPQGVAVVWVSGGIDGERYTLTNAITTDSTPIQRHEVRQLQLWVSAAA
jgi:hypothetical protein